MIIQDFSIDEYNWKVKVFYDIEDWAIPMIVDEVKLLGPYEEDIEDIYESLAKRTPNTGYIYSNILHQQLSSKIHLTMKRGTWQCI